MKLQTKQDRIAAAKEFVAATTTHRIEISDELFQKLEEVRKQKRLSGLGAAAEWYIEDLEKMAR